MTNVLWLDTLYLALFVLTSIAAVAALLTLAFGMFLLPQRVMNLLVVFFSALALGGVVAIVVLVLPWASG